MTNKNNLENENLIQMPARKKADRFKIWGGHIDLEGYVNEKDQVGYAFQKIGSQSFKINLWMFLNQSYFLIPVKEDQTKYVLYTVEEFLTESKELKSYWNKVGVGELYGNYLKLSFNLLPYDLFLSLFDEADGISTMALKVVV